MGVRGQLLHNRLGRSSNSRSKKIKRCSKVFSVCNDFLDCVRVRVRAFASGLSSLVSMCVVRARVASQMNLKGKTPAANLACERPLFARVAVLVVFAPCMGFCGRVAFAFLPIGFGQPSFRTRVKLQHRRTV